MKKVVYNPNSKRSRLLEKLRQFTRIGMNILEIQSTCFYFYFQRSNCRISHPFLRVSLNPLITCAVAVGNKRGQSLVRLKKGFKILYFFWSFAK